MKKTTKDIQMFCIENKIEEVINVAINTALKSKDFDSLTHFKEWVDKWDQGNRNCDFSNYKNTIQCPIILNVLYAAQEVIEYYNHPIMTFKRDHVIHYCLKAISSSLTNQDKIYPSTKPKKRAINRPV